MDTSDPTYGRDIRPLFREEDIESMSSQFDLSAYGDVRENADRILQTVSDGSMPLRRPLAPRTGRAVP